MCLFFLPATCGCQELAVSVGMCSFLLAVGDPYEGCEEAGGCEAPMGEGPSVRAGGSGTPSALACASLPARALGLRQPGQDLVAVRSESWNGHLCIAQKA